MVTQQSIGVEWTGDGRFHAVAGVFDMISSDPQIELHRIFIHAAADAGGTEAVVVESGAPGGIGHGQIPVRGTHGHPA